MSGFGTQRRQQGFVLILVLGMIMALTVILLNFNHSARVHLETADILRKSHQALNCAHTGLNIAIAAIRQNPPASKQPGLNSFWHRDRELTLEQGLCTVRLTTENGKLNINKLKDDKGKLDRRRIDQMLRLIDLLNQGTGQGERISYGIVPAIIDWTDNDDEITYLPFVQKENTGAESAHYRTLDRHVVPKNRALDTCSEILQIRGITPSVYQRLKDYITVKGDGRIDINRASKVILQCFSHEMDPAVAQIIINRRKLKPYTDLQELAGLPGMTSKLYAAICETATVAPTDLYYRIRLTGDTDGIQRQVEALVKRNTNTKNVDVIRYIEI